MILTINGMADKGIKTVTIPHKIDINNTLPNSFQRIVFENSTPVIKPSCLQK